jgi:hypothetical protein
MKPKTAKQWRSRRNSGEVFVRPLKKIPPSFRKGEGRDVGTVRPKPEVVGPIKLDQLYVLKDHTDTWTPPLQMSWAKWIVLEEEVVHRIRDVASGTSYASVSPLRNALYVRTATGLPFGPGESGRYRSILVNERVRCGTSGAQLRALHD